MLFPKYVLEDLSAGSGSIIGKSNIEEFFNHISMHKYVEEKSLPELAPSYEVASAYLIHMLEARFASLNPFMPHHRAARPAPGPRPQVVRPPWSTSGAAPSPIKTPRWEKPKYPITFPEYITIRHHR
jgi:hypothetical protein